MCQYVTLLTRTVRTARGLCVCWLPQLCGRVEVVVRGMLDVDPEDVCSEDVLLLVVSTYTDGRPPQAAKVSWCAHHSVPISLRLLRLRGLTLSAVVCACQFFCDWLAEAAVDFRVDDTFLSRVAFALFGLGSSLYEQNYNAVAKRVSRTQHTRHRAVVSATELSQQLLDDRVVLASCISCILISSTWAHRLCVRWAWLTTA